MDDDHRKERMESDDERIAKWDKLYRLYYDSLMSQARRYLPGQEDAEDIVLEAFEKVAGHLDKIGKPESTQAYNYLLAILKNCIRDQYRQQSKIMVESVDDERLSLPSVDVDNVEEMVLHKLSCREMMTCLQDVEYQYKAALVLRYYSNASRDQIAQVLGKNKEQISALLNRAKRKALQKLQERYSELIP